MAELGVEAETQGLHSHEPLAYLFIIFPPLLLPGVTVASVTLKAHFSSAGGMMHNKKPPRLSVCREKGREKRAFSL